ncbi:MAG: amidase [Acidobacteria bacterium]|nr:MAG: amidase [Acidobacteriota bacterium]
MNRRTFLGVSALGSRALALTAQSEAPSSKPAPVKAFELDEITISELAEGMQSGKYTAQSITQKYLERIEAIDKRGPGLNSVIEINPDALALAEKLDQERRERHVRGPLHGLPVLIKDNIDTADRMMTTAGSLALVGSIPRRDAFVARRLRESGAVILGKTNLSEWANFRSGHSISGWSGRGGQTRNPYALDRNPCGSSSGSGAAAAANLCAVAVGTETDGSVTCPSSINGLVGIKPTLGLVSRSGIIPIAHSQDTAGPMTRTVADAAVLLSTMAGIDPDDSVTNESGGRAQPDYTKFLDPNGLRRARIGVARKYFGFNEQVDKLMAAALDTMKRLGAEIIDPADIPTTGKFGDSEMEVLLYEFKADLNSYLERLGPQAPVKSMKDIIDFNEKHAAQELPYFGQDIMIKSQSKGPLTTPAYLKALKKNHELSRKKGIDAVMAEHKLDVLVAPTAPPAWLIDLATGDHSGGGDFTGPAAIAGYPHITVPAGYVFGLPVGISFVGKAYSENVLIRLAYAFEQATKVRKPPRFLKGADLLA